MARRSSWRTGVAAGTAAVATVAIVALAGWPGVARACGGFFCAGSVPMDQAGENIVFAVEPDGTLETHVQINYRGTAPRFAWILPVPTLPELALGTDALFRALADRTAPRFDLASRTEGSCRPLPSCHYPSGCPTPGGWDGPRDASAPAADAGSGGVTVVLRETVGAFDAAVLTATDATALHDWLRANEYDLPEESIPLLAAYVEAGDHFVALRLVPGRETGEIQPLVLRYQEREPCIPIRLTAIATLPDMPITAYVLGATRAASANYSFVETPEEPGLWLGTASYPALVSAAVDAAGGRAFVTEFAGATPEVGLELGDIEHLRTAGSASELVLGLLAAGFMGDSQLLAILLRVLPPPEGMDPQAYYNCLAGGGFGGFCPDPEGFDPSAVVDALDEAIVVPRRRAQALVARHAQTTRFFTTMSADEMTLDPVFRLDDGMPEVSHVHTATLVTECSPTYFERDAPQRLELPSGARARAREGHQDSRDDEAVCQSMGGTLGTPPPTTCPGTPGGLDAGSGARDGGPSTDGGAGGGPSGWAVAGGGGGCAVAGTRSGGELAGAWLGVVAAALAAALRRARRRG